MALVLDTDLVPAEHRRDALTAAMRATSGSSRVDLEDDARGVAGRLQLWSFGETAIFQAGTTGVSLVRDAKAVGAGSPDVLALAVQGAGLGRHQTGEDQRVVRPGDLMVVDVTKPFDFSWSGRGASTALHVPLGALGLSQEAVTRAAARLGSSPLYGVVARLITELARDAERISASASAAAAGEAGIRLTRALLDVAAHDGAQSGDTLEETLLTQVRAYVAHNLGDPDLGSDSVAAALAVSRRQLYRACERAGFSLEQYVIERRLLHAKAELAESTSRHLTIATIAQRWGFKDPTHFTRRFRSTFGLLPSEWRRLSDRPPT